MKQNVSTNSRPSGVLGQITVVAVTGGPCAGKTTLIEKVRNVASSMPNVQVFFAPEAATILLKSGLNPKSCGDAETFQRFVLEQQLKLEEHAYTAALKYAKQDDAHKAIIVCDRGLMDGAAYFADFADFENLLAEYRMKTEDVYKRYDKVVFLRSAAVGAPEFYTTMDGTPRSETIDEAIMRDKGVYDVWCNHHNFETVENSFKFYEKLDYAVMHIFGAAGISLPSKKFKRYIIDVPDLYDIVTARKASVSSQQFFFLKTDTAEQVVFVKINRKGSEVRYSMEEIRQGNVKNQQTDTLEYTRIYEQEWTITESEFMTYLERLDPMINHLVRTIFYFNIDFSVRCELALYPYSKKYALLKVYMDTDSTEEEELVKSQFKILKDVTNDMSYSVVEIAKHGSKVFEVSTN